MLIKAGLRYVRRDGVITGTMLCRANSGKYNYIDYKHKNTYMVNGQYMDVPATYLHPYDLVSVYEA